MKKLHSILCTAFAVLTCAIHAQSLTPTAGYSATKLFDTAAGETITGLEFDALGNAYYLVGDGFSTFTRLERRTSADGYSTPATLFNFGASKFGSFVRLNSGKLYFGESSDGTIRVHDLGLSSNSLLSTVGGNYDLDFSGGIGWLSANPGFAGNKLFKLDLGTGATTEIFSSNDFSGPVALDLAGQLYYGASGSTFAPLPASNGGIYRYSASEANAGGLTLDAPHIWSANGINAYFDFDPTLGLYQTNFSSIQLFDTATATFATIGTSSESIGHLASAPGILAVAVTDFGTSKSSVFTVVPEPSSLFLAAISAALLLRRRRD